MIVFANESGVPVVPFLTTETGLSVKFGDSNIADQVWGYGGIGYYHVSDTCIALFSRFIPCGVHEAVYILDGLLKLDGLLGKTTLNGGQG